MTLGEKQELFMRLLPRLLDAARVLGFEMRGGELLRTKEQAELNASTGVGIANSVHTLKLAIDLNFFRHGAWITDSDHPKLVELGDYWESLHPLCRWGGRFDDGGHFSLEHNGVR